MSSSQLMSSPGVAASKSTSSRRPMSSWYGKRCPASSSASSWTRLIGSDIGSDIYRLLVHRRGQRLELRPVAERFLLVLALEELPDLRQRLVLGNAGDVVRARQRHLRHRRGLHRERAKVLRLERVDVRLAARAREHLHLERQRVQEVVDALGGLFDDEPFAQLRVLRGDADGATAGVAVIALTRRHADGALVVGHAWDLL